MRFSIATVVCSLLASSACVLAERAGEGTPKSFDYGSASESTTQETGDQGPELAVVANGADGRFCFRMGDTLTVRATGRCFSKIRTELTKGTGPRALTLYLDGVAMAKLPQSAVETVAGKELLLSFRLARNPHDDENRKAWDTLLRNQDSYTMTLWAALGIGNEPALAVSSPFQFYVVRDEVIRWALCVGVVLFLGAYYLLYRHSTVLRDEAGLWYSLGKSQMAFWGLLVFLTFTAVWILTGTVEWIPEQVLILLGISGATGLSAILIRESKKASRKAEIDELRKEQEGLEKEKLANGTPLPQVSIDRLKAIGELIAAFSQPPVADRPPAFWRDICDGGNGMSFHRVQVVAWTALLGVVFVWSVAQAMSMPEFPQTLLVLLGISNGTYLGFKIPEKS